MALPLRNVLEQPQQWVSSFRPWLQQVWDHINELPGKTTPRGAWSATPVGNPNYGVADYVVFGAPGSTYVCVVPHTPTVFATDLAAGYWKLDDNTALEDDLQQDGALQGSAKIGHRQRTVKAWLDDKVHVFRHMTAAQVADCKAGTKLLDVTAAVQSALNDAAANGTYVVDWMGVKDCLISSTLAVPARVTNIGYAVEVTFSMPNAVGFSCGEDPAFLGFRKIKGPGNSVYAGSSRAIECKTVRGSGGLPPTRIKGPTIKSTNIDGWGSTAVWMEYCKGSDIDASCELTNLGYAGVLGVGCRDCHADGVTVDTVSPGSGGQAYGVAWTCEQTLGATRVEMPVSQDCSADYATVSNIPIWEGLDTHGGINISFCHGTFRNVRHPVAFVPGDIGPTEDVAPRNCKGNYNRVLEQPVTTGVVVNIVGITGGMLAHGCEASGNYILGGGIAGSGTSGAVKITATRGVQLHNNVVEGAVGQAAITIMNDNYEFNISGGTLKDTSDATVTTCAGVAVRSNNNTGYIGGITFVRENTALPNVMANSILVSGGLTGLDIALGRCHYVGDTTTALALSGGLSAGVISSGVDVRGASGSIAQTSGSTSNLVDIVFAKPMIAVPRISVQLTSTPSGGMPSFEIANESRTGFRVISRPSVGGTWSASTTTTFFYRAEV